MYVSKREREREVTRFNFQRTSCETHCNLSEAAAGLSGPCSPLRATSEIKTSIADQTPFPICVVESAIQCHNTKKYFET